MARIVSASARQLTVAGLDTGIANLDVRFDGHRVWSLSADQLGAERRGVRSLAWSPALRPYLRGVTEVTLVDPATEETLARREARFTSDDSRTEVTDVHGRWLAVNKWDRLGPNFEGDTSGVQDRLLDNGVRLVALLEELGHDVYIVGGTLLGAMRNGQLLPHDDDMDLAVYSDATNPLDLTLENLAMERQLVEHGFVCVRHSFAHLQVTFFREDGSTDHYIDIFAGFSFDDEYGQPFALLGPEITRRDLLPVSRVTIDGRGFPAPRVPAAWLTFAYGPNWRVPDPSFSFVTPPTTLRRFETWFGVFNRQRVYWEKAYESQIGREPIADWERADVDRFLEALPAGASVIDLGCGDGRLTELIAQKAGRVVGIDYSHEALRHARASKPANVDYEYLNLNDRAAVVRFMARAIKAREEWFVFSHHTIQGIARANRYNVFLLLKHVLRGAGFAQLTFDTDLSSHYEKQNPTRWHFTIDWLRRESKRHALRPTVLGSGRRVSDVEQRQTATVRLSPFIPAAAGSSKGES